MNFKEQRHKRTEEKAIIVANIRPEDYAVAPSINQWGYIQVPKDNAIYDFLSQVKATTDPAFQLINLGLSVLNTILDFVSSLLIDITQPIKIALDALIALIEGLIRDLKSLGIYFTWDYDLFEDPITYLAGGYSSFESRSILKLLDKKDRTRPDFSDQSKVFCLTFFGGADPSGINRLIQKLNDLFSLFGATPTQNPSRSVSGLSVKYYGKLAFAHTEMSPASIDLDNKPSGIRIKWEYPPTNIGGINLPPPTFIVSVKTTSAKESIRFKVAQPASTTGASFEGSLQDPANPRVDAPAELLSILSNDVGNQNDKVYLQAEDGANTITSTLDDYYSKYRTYFVQSDSSLGRFFGDTTFGLDIPFERLPTGGDGGYIVSVRSCSQIDLNTEDLKDLEGDGGYDGKPKTRILKADLKPISKISITPSVLSLPTEELTIPKMDSDIKLQYGMALKEALCLFFLNRLETTEGRAFLNVQMSSYQVGLLTKYLDIKKILKENKTATMVSIASAVENAISELLPAMPAESVLAPLRTHIEKLNNKNKDHVPLYPFIRKSLTDGTNNGIGSLVSNLSLDTELQSNGQQPLSSVSQPQIEATTEQTASVIPAPASPPSVSPLLVTEIKGLSGVPIIYCDNAKLRGYIRNPITAEQYYSRAVAQMQGMEDLCKSAVAILSVVVPKDKAVGQWVNLRLGDFVGLSGVVDVLDDLKDYTEALAAGLSGIVETIKKYIAQIKNRIAEIQRIIARIKAILDAVLSFRFPAGLYVLPTISDGTTGAVREILSAQRKPDIQAGGYGAGGMLVLGGVPSLLVDFFVALIGGES